VHKKLNKNPSINLAQIFERKKIEFDALKRANVHRLLSTLTKFPFQIFHVDEPWFLLKETNLQPVLPVSGGRAWAQRFWLE
jgi:hypothetical protein